MNNTNKRRCKLDATTSSTNINSMDHQFSTKEIWKDRKLKLPEYLFSFQDMSPHCVHSQSALLISPLEQVSLREICQKLIYSPERKILLQNLSYKVLWEVTTRYSVELLNFLSSNQKKEKLILCEQISFQNKRKTEKCINKFDGVADVNET